MKPKPSPWGVCPRHKTGVIICSDCSREAKKVLARMRASIRKDKARLDWLTKHGDFHAYGDSIYVRVMPESLENGQTVRGAIDADMRQARQS